MLILKSTININTAQYSCGSIGKTWHGQGALARVPATLLHMSQAGILR